MAYYLAQVSGLLNSSFPWSMNFVLSATESESSVAALFNTAIRGVFTDVDLTAYIPTTVEITETSVSTASPTFKQTTKTVTTGTTAGTGTSVSMPYQICPIVTWRTSYATKWGRGRSFMPPLGVNALAAGGFTMLTAAQDAVQHAWNGYFTAVSATYQHVIMHPKATAGGARAAYSTDTVTGADTPNVFGVQTRRADKLVPSRLPITV